MNYHDEFDKPILKARVRHTKQHFLVEILNFWSFMKNYT